MTNARRREAARQALLAHARCKGDPEMIDGDSVIDLLADLMHLCDLKETADFEPSLEAARGHYRFETRQHRKEKSP